MDTRGTITYGASDISCIESEDVWLLDVQEGPNGMAAHIRYRTFNDGRAEGYIPLSLISSNNGKISGYYTSGGDFQVAVEDPYTVTSDHHIAFGDSIYFISDEGGGMYCIMYNLDAGGWRIAYCRSSDFSRYAVY